MQTIEARANVEAMTLCQIAKKYGIDIRTLKKWLLHFAQDIKPPIGSIVYTPDQVKKIVEACGEFPG